VFQRNAYKCTELNYVPIKVNEKGSEAAAVTGGGIVVKFGGDDQEPQKFIANHPFLFSIVDTKEKVILFLGHYYGNTKIWNCLKLTQHNLYPKYFAMRISAFRCMGS